MFYSIIDFLYFLCHFNMIINTIVMSKDKIRDIQGTRVDALLEASGSKEKAIKLHEFQGNLKNNKWDEIFARRKQAMDHIRTSPDEVSEMIDDEILDIDLLDEAKGSDQSLNEALSTLRRKEGAREFSEQMVWPLIKHSTKRLGRIVVDPDVITEIIEKADSVETCEKVNRLLERLFKTDDRRDEASYRYWWRVISPLIDKSNKKIEIFREIEEIAPDHVAPDLNPEEVLEPFSPESIKARLNAQDMTARDLLKLAAELAGGISDDEREELLRKAEKVLILVPSGKDPDILPEGEVWEPENHSLSAHSGESSKPEFRLDQLTDLLKLDPIMIIPGLRFSKDNDGYIAAIVRAKSGKLFAICDANTKNNAMYIFSADNNSWVRSFQRPKSDFLDVRTKHNIPGFIGRKRHSARDKITPLEHVRNILSA
jgi:hypothetical protein